jgi:hypothetical protein
VFAIRKGDEDLRVHQYRRTWIDHIVMLAAQPGQAKRIEWDAIQQVTKFFGNDAQILLLSRMAQSNDRNPRHFPS